MDGIIHPSEHKDEELLGVSGDVQRSQVVPQSFHLLLFLIFTMLKDIEKTVIYGLLEVPQAARDCRVNGQLVS